MNLITESYVDQKDQWPSAGRVILAQYDEESIVVYQAYRPEIGHFAARNGFFGGQFKLSRMSWIKPNFLWMMYRCGWATKEGQEVVLAVRILRSAFDEILRRAVYSSFNPTIHESRVEWQSTVSASDVRLQWDPDHSPSGGKLERRAIQLGLRGDILKKYSREWIVDIQDVTSFVAEQRDNSISSRYSQLVVPRERIYPVTDQSIIDNIRLEHF